MSRSISWSSKGLWTRVEPEHITPNVVAEYDILAGPDAERLCFFQIGLRSLRHFVLNRNSGQDESLMRHYEQPPDKFAAEWKHADIARTVVHTAQLYQQPVVCLTPRRNAVEVISSVKSPKETEQGNVYMPYPTGIRFSGHVGEYNGVISNNPVNGKPYRLAFNATYFPQRLEDKGHNFDIEAPVTTGTGVGNVQVYWREDYSEVDAQQSLALAIARGEL